MRRHHYGVYTVRADGYDAKFSPQLSFQLRGLEFTGTYCQQREVEALEQDEPALMQEGKIPNVHLLRSMIDMRWRTWKTVTLNYRLDGYAISRLKAEQLFAEWDQRKRLMKFVVECICYYTVRHPDLFAWLEAPHVVERKR